MPSIALQRHDVIVGVDTHKDKHIAVAIDGLGGLIDKPKLAAATPDGYAELLVWAQSLGEIHAFGVEGCGSYGSGLARFLRRHGHIVHEVARPPRKGERRLSGKSDPIDAEHAARTVLSGSGTATPKLANGQIEAVRVIKIARDTAVKARTAAIITLKSLTEKGLSGISDLWFPCCGYAAKETQDVDRDHSQEVCAVRHSICKRYDGRRVEVDRTAAALAETARPSVRTAEQ